MTLFLKDNCVLDEPYFTFRLRSKQSKREIVFSATDISDTNNYSKFLIKVVQSNPVLTLGEISAETGEYNFEVYESGTPENIILADCIGIIKKGILRIEGIKQTIPVAEYYPETIKVSNI